MNQNPYESPKSDCGEGPIQSTWKFVLVVSAALGVIVSALILYYAITLPVVRSQSGASLQYQIPVVFAKWGSILAIASGTFAYMNLKRSAINKLCLVLSFAPAATVIGLYITWVVLFA